MYNGLTQVSNYDHIIRPYKCINKEFYLTKRKSKKNKIKIQLNRPAMKYKINNSRVICAKSPLVNPSHDGTPNSNNKKKGGGLGDEMVFFKLSEKKERWRKCVGNKKKVLRVFNNGLSANYLVN